MINAINDHKSATLLIVDDELSNVRLLEKLLSREGYTALITTQNPLEALDIIKNQHIDLLLVDLNMPVMNGHELMANIKQLNLDISPTTLMLTAQHDQENRHKALNGGARDYLTKPFHAQELFSRVRNLLEVHLANQYMRSENKILEQKVQERTLDIYNTRLQVVRCLGRAAEYRDEETGFHIIRMSKVSALLAKAAGLSENDCELLLNASAMHDIGKIGIPDHILLKQGKFEADEWEIMKAHTIIGARILDGDSSDLMTMARDIALSHHEKWNGKGYPNGLKGSEIPLVGRITAIADVFDALTSIRPYKKPWPIDEAISFIVNESGEHFDPQLVQIFTEQLPDILAIGKEYAETAETIGSDQHHYQ